MAIDQQRLLQLFTLVKDCSFGTLWWVANTIWMRHPLLRVLDRDGTHPGVSVAASWPRENPDVVPMLFGTSKSSCHAFVTRVKGDRLCYFLSMKPLKLQARDFFGNSAVEASPKRRLDADEIKRLKAFLEGKLQ